MFRHSFHYLAVPVFLVVMMLDASAKDPVPAKPPPKKESFDEYRQFLKPPEAVPEYWSAIQFEIELGSYELASRHLRGLLEVKKPTEEELYQLERQVGMAAILKLHNQFAPWLRDIRREQSKLDALPPEEKMRQEVVKKIKEFEALRQTETRIDTLINLTSGAVRKVLTDPLRIKKYINLLYATPEEQQFALGQLRDSKAAVVPFMIDELRMGVEPEKRLIILAALRRLSPEILPALVAALDTDDAVLKVELIDIFLARVAREVTPHLWFLAASPAQPEKVREKAREALAYFSIPPERFSSDRRVMERELAKAVPQLPSSKVELTRQAEKFYRHDVEFGDPKGGYRLALGWEKRLVAGWPGAPVVPASKAEEYYGVRYASQALALDPTYLPAQVALMSLILEKAYETGGFDRPLAKADPNVHAVVSSVNPDVLIAVLERALDEKRIALILAATRTLGDLAEVRATRPTEGAEPSLTRALLFPDRRVQMAASEALLRVPGQRSALTCSRIVDVLRRALAAETVGAPKVMIGYVNDEFSNKVAETVKQAGYDPIAVKNGRDLLKRAFSASDIEAIIFDADLPDPGLTSLLAQLRGDVHASRLPLFITPPHQKEDLLIAELQKISKLMDGAAPGNLPSLQLRRDQVEAELTIQSMASAAAMERWAKVYRHVIPLATSSVINVNDLGPELRSRVGLAVLSESELKDYAEKAVGYLARAAKGELAFLDVTPAGDTVLAALRSKKLSPDGQIAAIEIVGRLPGHAAQTELVRAVLDADEKRPPKVRLTAVSELVRHLQRFNPLLSEAEVLALRDSYTKSVDPAYKAALVQVFGALRPDARTSGDILRGYQPKPPAPPAPPVPDK